MPSTTTDGCTLFHWVIHARHALGRQRLLNHSDWEVPVAFHALNFYFSVQQFWHYFIRQVRHAMGPRGLSNHIGQEGLAAFTCSGSLIAVK
jgi:hypothetical protein